ncbi:hypothetical protein BX666DRAFT_1988668 [Dichotomocladium elegans]|nr:hypothetical protein BX666DRAFT_1988668 [Dichotomocladium elegans]
MFNNFLRRLYPLQSIKLLIKTLRAPVRVASRPSGNESKIGASISKNTLDDVTQILKLLNSIHKTALQSSVSSTRAPSKNNHALQQELKKAVGFSVHKRPSTIPDAGYGVFLEGHCSPGQVVCFYPGSIYLPSEPLFFVSIANSYILKCFDGIFVDGKSRGLSGYVFRSLFKRENWPGAIQTSDVTWMADTAQRNPFAIGQIVNNGSHRHPPNVQYQEVDLPPSFPMELRQYIPNIYWSEHDPSTENTRVVVLVATREIADNSELFSTYMDSTM